MTTRPLVYVCVRPQANAAAAEYESFRAGTRLDHAGLEMWDLVNKPLPADAFERWSGFLVGGSPFNVTDPESTKTEVQRRLEADLETIAGRATASETTALFTCYGIGVVTRMLGGEVSRAFPEDTGPVAVRLTAEAATDPVYGALADHFWALTAHKEGAGTAPAGSVLLAENDGCPVQGYRLGDSLYTAQFHPEPTAAAFVERMQIYRDDGYFEARDFDVIAGRVTAASITEPLRLLRAFAKTFAA